MTAAIDPFGPQAQQAPAEEAQQPTPPSDPWSPPPAAAPAPTVVQGADGKVVLTFKGGTAFSDPWVVVHAGSLDEALSYLDPVNGPKMAELFERVRRASNLFLGSGGGAPAPSTNGSAPAAAPAAANQPPAGAPASPGAGWTYKTGSKNGRVWHGWFPPYAQKDSLKPVFFDV
jgi:hypothetical protein